MKGSVRWSVSVLWAACLIMAFGPATVIAQKSGQSKTSQPNTQVDPPTAKNASGIELTPSGFHWGMSLEELYSFYEKQIDMLYKPLYMKAQPGPQTSRLDAEAANAKAALRRGLVDFGNLPTGVDSTPLKGEYSYRNQEQMVTISLKDQPTRYVFLIRGKVWKCYDEVKSSNFDDIKQRKANALGISGRTIQTDYSANRAYVEVDWVDLKTHLRLIDRSGTGIVGVVAEDRIVSSNLASLRANKAVETSAGDPAVQAQVRPGRNQASTDATGKTVKK